MHWHYLHHRISRCRTHTYNYNALTLPTSSHLSLPDAHLQLQCTDTTYIIASLTAGRTPTITMHWHYLHHHISHCRTHTYNYNGLTLPTSSRLSLPDAHLQLQCTDTTYIIASLTAGRTPTITMHWHYLHHRISHCRTHTYNYNALTLPTSSHLSLPDAHLQLQCTDTTYIIASLTAGRTPTITMHWHYLHHRISHCRTHTYNYNALTLPTSSHLSLPDAHLQLQCTDTTYIIASLTAGRTPTITMHWHYLHHRVSHCRTHTYNYNALTLPTSSHLSLPDAHLQLQCTDTTYIIASLTAGRTPTITMHWHYLHHRVSHCRTHTYNYNALTLPTSSHLSCATHTYNYNALTLPTSSHLSCATHTYNYNALTLPTSSHLSCATHTYNYNALTLPTSSHLSLPDAHLQLQCTDTTYIIASLTAGRTPTITMHWHYLHHRISHCRTHTYNYNALTLPTSSRLSLPDAHLQLQCTDTTYIIASLTAGRTPTITMHWHYLHHRISRCRTHTYNYNALTLPTSSHLSLPDAHLQLQCTDTTYIIASLVCHG